MGYTSYALDLFNCPGYWDSGLTWHEGHFGLSTVSLVDVLGVRDLKQPEIDFDKLARFPGERGS